MISNWLLEIQPLLCQLNSATDHWIFNPFNPSISINPCKLRLSIPDTFCPFPRYSGSIHWVTGNIPLLLGSSPTSRNSSPGITGHFHLHLAGSPAKIFTKRCRLDYFDVIIPYFLPDWNRIYGNPRNQCEIKSTCEIKVITKRLSQDSSWKEKC